MFVVLTVTGLLGSAWLRSALLSCPQMSSWFIYFWSSAMHKHRFPLFKQPLSMENLPKYKQGNFFLLERVFFFFSFGGGGFAFRPQNMDRRDRESLFTARCPRLFVPACQRHDKPSAGSWSAVMDGGETDVYFGGEVWRNPLTIRCRGGEFREFLLQRFDKWLHFSNSDVLLKVISFSFFFFQSERWLFQGCSIYFSSFCKSVCRGGLGGAPGSKQREFISVNFVEVYH